MDPRNQPAQDDEDLLRDIRKILDDRHDADDPYERGFADKLYEDCEDPTLQTQQLPRRQQNSVSGPVIHAYNSDFRRGAAPQRREEPTTYLGPVEEDDNEPPRRQSQRSRREPERAPRREEQPRRHRAVPESGYDAEPPKKKKKHRFARGLGKLLLILLVLFALVIGVMLLLAKQPKAEETLGARRDGCSTILLAGTDKSGDRTDTVMLLSVDRSAKRLTLLSIPRDTKVNSTYTPHKINIAYGVNGKDQEGMEALMDYVTELVGFRPDGYVLIDLDVFVDLVDKMGGVKFDVPCDMDYSDPAQDLTIDLKAGMQRLNGEQAMGLVRFRSGYAMADLQRVNVQRDFMLAAMHQWVSVWNLWRLPSAARLLSAHTVTDLSTRNLVWLAESVALCGTSNLQTLTIPYTFSGDGMYVLADPYETADVVNAYLNPYETDVSPDDIYGG